MQKWIASKAWMTPCGSRSGQFIRAIPSLRLQSDLYYAESVIRRTPEQERYLNGLKEFALAYSESTLNRNQSQEGICKIIRKVSLAADQNIHKLEAARAVNPVQCHKGCWHCCTQFVATTIPEILRLAAYIRETFAADEIVALLERLKLYRETNSALPPDRRAKLLRTQCPLLQDGICSVFEARPLVCRGFNSTDVEACIRIKENPGSTEKPTRSTSQLEVTFMLRDGMREALEARGISGVFVELSLALEIALREPEAGDRYLAGEPLFASACLDSKADADV